MLNKNHLANVITEYSQTVTSKVIGVVGGGSAVANTPIGSFVKEYFDIITSWPWMQALSYIALFLLVVERGFIVWAWNNKRKRGEI